MTQERKRDERCCCYCIVSDSPSGGISIFTRRKSSFLCVVALIFNPLFFVAVVNLFCSLPLSFHIAWNFERSQTNICLDHYRPVTFTLRFVV
jgi:hypothetical protein